MFLLIAVVNFYRLTLDATSTVMSQGGGDGISHGPGSYNNSSNSGCLDLLVMCVDWLEKRQISPVVLEQIRYNMI